MRAKISIIVSMLIFGSVGMFVKNINLSSPEIALFRAIIASLFLIMAGTAIRVNISIKDIKANGLLLILSGACMGINWVALFQGYKYTTISNAILGYYSAPIFVIMLSPVVLKEKITLTKIICTLTAMLGLFLIIKSGDGIGGDAYSHMLGMTYAIFGAILYATVILINKCIKDLSGFETTLLQLMVAATTLLPVVMIQLRAQGGSPPVLLNMGAKSWVNILLLGIVHTGIAYLLYFRSIKEINAQSIAILSYIDPVSAVIMAIIFLGEDLTLNKIIGGILILGSTYFAERIDSKLKRESSLV